MLSLPKLSYVVLNFPRFEKKIWIYLVRRLRDSHTAEMSLSWLLPQQPRLDDLAADGGFGIKMLG